jgi:hypothetical protein
VDALQANQLLLSQRQRQRIAKGGASMSGYGIATRLEELAIRPDAAQELAD